MDLLERERNLADLNGWFESVTDRSGCVVLVGGEAGVGKTVLIQQFSDRPHGARVLWGACDALFTPQPLAPLYDIARQTQGALLAAIASGAARDAIFTCALEELERTKTLVIFEDLHWADEATLDLLRYLGRRIRRTQAMLVVTYRDDEIGARHPLRLVIGELPRASTHRILVSPLSESAVGQLAERAGRSAKDLHSITGGNPLFVTEVLASTADTVPATVRDAVLARAGRLSPSARDIAEMVCVVPGRAETWLVEQALHLNEQDIEDCAAIGMARSEDATLAYRHELVRRAIEQSLSPLRLCNLHSRVLAALATRPDIPAARLAHHASAAHDPAQVQRYAPLAGAQAAAVGAHREAVSHYELALRHGENLPTEERVRLQELLSIECTLTAHDERAIELECLALKFWRSSGSRLQEGRALRLLATMSWSAGQLAAALQYAKDAVTVLQALPPSADLALAYCIRADQDMEWHEIESSIDWARQAIAIGEALGRSDIVCEALNTLGTSRLIGGDRLGTQDLERSLSMALAGTSDAQLGSCYMSSAAMAVSRREYGLASHCIERGLSLSIERDLDPVWLYLLVYRARMRFEQGDWNGAGDDAGTVLSHPYATQITRVPALRTLGHLRIRRGDPDANSPLAEARTISTAAPQLQRLGTLAAVMAEAAWLADDLEGVVREVRGVYDLLQFKRDPRMKGELAAWLWRAGSLEQTPTDIAEPYRSEIAGDWQGAARAWQSFGCPYEHACMLAWYGSESEQREALLMLERLGAAPAAQSLRRKMRTTGVRSIPRGSRTSTRVNPLGLTRREAEILDLLSQGLRNSGIARQLFVSTKTVDHHVSAILSKLRVPSRAEAVVMARKLSQSQG
ncbi:MAG: AAA family ATPase [Steroidobacteraceae bacterium]